MENLKPLRRHNASIIFGAFFSVAALVLLTVIALLVLQDSKIFAYCAGAVVALGGTVAASIVLSHSTLKSSEFLSMAILHVTRDNQVVGAPDVTTVPAAQDFMNSLAQTVYEIAANPLTQATPKTTPGNDFQKELLQNTPLAIYALNKDGSLTYANQAGIVYAGLKIPEAIGQKFYDVIKLSFASTDTLESWLKASENTTATATHTWERVQLELPGKVIKQCDMAVHFSKDNPNGIESVIILFDQTVRYSKDDHGASFVSMAVHELRTPLTVMRGYIELFEDEIAPKLDTEQAVFMRNLSAQAEQLAAFVSNVQNFARIEANELNLNLKEEAWGAIVEGAVKDMNLRANVRKKTLQYQIAPDLPTVAVDRSTIYEVLVNLIENAVKYTHIDAPVTIRTYKKDANWVETVVEDKGIGIPEGVIGRIFEKFYRSHRSSQTVGGTGLGLFLSKTIVTAHGGEIWVKSHEGEGSTFGFTIPTFESVASQLTSADNKTIVRGAHGWIKNHTLYRG
ncbi:MAG: ATP-binding protein [Patescibacteria group bacterium]